VANLARVLMYLDSRRLLSRTVRQINKVSIAEEPQKQNAEKIALRERINAEL
jgi:hypothetical protein